MGGSIHDQLTWLNKVLTDMISEITTTVNSFGNTESLNTESVADAHQRLPAHHQRHEQPAGEQWHLVAEQQPAEHQPAEQQHHPPANGPRSRAVSTRTGCRPPLSDQTRRIRTMGKIKFHSGMDQNGPGDPAPGTFDSPNDPVDNGGNSPRFEQAGNRP